MVISQCSPLVAPPRMICEALEAAVRGVISVTPVHWTATKEKKKARKTGGLGLIWKPGWVVRESEVE